MLVAYRYRFDAAYIKAVIAHQYAQGPTLLKLPVQFGALGVFFGSLFAWLIDAPVLKRILAGLLVACTVTLVGMLSVRAGLLSRFRSKAEFGTEVSASISDDGLVFEGGHAQTRLKWEHYPRAVRFHDGILLQKSGAIRWLPDAAIVVGTAQDATHVVERKTTLRHVA